MLIKRFEKAGEILAIWSFRWTIENGAGGFWYNTVSRPLLFQRLEDFYGISIAFVIHSLDHSLFIRLIAVRTLQGMVGGGALPPSLSARLLDLYGISIAFLVQSVDHSLFSRLIPPYICTA